MRSILLSFSLFLFATALYSQNVSVTFRIDMSAENVSNLGVHIAGNFQEAAGLGDNWNPGSTLATDSNGDNIYEITVSLPSGTYQYKFINGNAWGMDENPPGECSVGNTNNREVVVGNSDMVLPAFPFNGCIQKLRLSVNMTGLDISPEGVHVMGNFQEAAGFSENWNLASTPMEDLNGDGTYEVEFVVPPGTYQYVFINGITENDVENLSEDCTVAGELDYRSRVYTFNPGAANPPVVCFNSCEECHPAVVFDYDTQWWNDAVFYEIFVRSFYDSNGDGIGDFQGMIEKLDYLNDGDPDTNDDLGITGIWLMPMMESPSYHGYDVSDYYATEPDFGSMQDFEAFLDAAHERGIKVIIDLVMNHSSNQHPWFQQSANNSGGYRDWYIWSDNNPGNSGPWGQQIWHPNGGDYYYGLFWGGMPDLNYTHPPVKEEMFNVVNFWLDKNIDGYRLDAIKYLVEEGNQLENVPETFSLLEEFNDVYKGNNPDAFTVGEVWSSTSSIIPYVQNDRLDVCFEFGLAGAILDAVNNSNPGSLEQQLTTVQTAYPALQYATFLTNHDMDRLSSVLGGSTTKMKQAASLYLTLPGIPFVYYGEELGMTGTGDHLNIRRPMQWSGGSNGGFSSSNPWNALGPNYTINNVEDMAANSNSLLSHYRDMIHIRNEQIALRRGQTLLLDHNVNNAVAFARVYEDEGVLVVANTGTSSIMPTLSLEQSALPSGQYFVTDLLRNEALGMISINANGGFSNWQANGQNLAGRSTWILSLSTENPVSTNIVPKAAAQIQIIPNPAVDQAEIIWDASEISEGQIEVRTAAGQRLFSDRVNSGKVLLNTETWPAGMYYIKIWNEEKEGIAKLLIL
jgi:glycosidase